MHTFSGIIASKYKKYTRILFLGLILNAHLCMSEVSNHIP